MNKNSGFTKNIPFSSLDNINAFILSLLIMGELINDFLSFILKTDDIISKMLLVLLFMGLYLFLYLKFFERDKWFIKDVLTIICFGIIYIIYNFIFMNVESNQRVFEIFLLGMVIFNLTRMEKPKWNPIIAPFLIFILIILMNITFKGYHGEYETYKISYFIIKTLIALIYVMTSLNLRNLKATILYLISYSIMSGVFVFLTYLTGIGINELGVLSIIGGDKLVTSFALGQIFIVILFMMRSWRHKTRAIIIIISLIILLYLMLISGARGPIVSLFVTIFIITIKIRGIKHKIVIMVVILLSIGFTYTSYFQNMITENYGVERIWDFAQIGKQSESVDINKESSGRLNVYIQAIEDFENNIIFGKGIGRNETEGWYPHNSLLEILSQIGIIGFASFVLVLMFWLYRFMKFTFDIRNGFMMYYFLFIYIFAESLFSGSIFMNISFWVLLIVTSYLIYNKESEIIYEGFYKSSKNMNSED